MHASRITRGRGLAGARRCRLQVLDPRLVLTTFAEAVLADAPVAYWSLDEAALGDPVVDSAGSFDGVHVGNPTVGIDTAELPGLPDDNRGVSSPTTNDRVEIADPGASDLDFAAGDQVTIEALVKIDDINPNEIEAVVGKGRLSGDDDRNWGLRVRSTDGTNAFISFIYRNAAGTDFHVWNSNNAFIEGSGWHHIAVTYTFGNGGSIEGYVDGQVVGGSWVLNDGNDAPIVNDLPVGIGASTPSNAFDSGVIDEVAIYRTALSQAQLVAHYDAALLQLTNGFDTPVEVVPGQTWTDTVTIEDAAAALELELFNGTQTDVAGPLLPGLPAVNTALEFDGVDDIARTEPRVEDFMNGATNFSASLFARFDNTTADHTILSKGEFSGTQPILWWRDDVNSNNPAQTDTLAIMISDNNTEARAVAPAGTLNNTDWNHLAFTFAANQADGLKLFVNGVEVDSVSTMGVDSINATATRAILGRASTGATTNYLDGALDEVVFFDSTLSAADIQAQFDAATTGLTDDAFETAIADQVPLGYWQFDEMAGVDSVFSEPAGRYDVTIDYGDGTVEMLTVNGPNNQFTFEHIYESYANLTPTITATETLLHGRTDVESYDLSVQPVVSDGQDLFVGGEDGREFITIVPSGMNEARVDIAGQRFTAPVGIDAVINVFGNGGDDIIRLYGRLPSEWTANFDGGDGDDYLAGNAFNDILIGGAGNDRLLSGAGDNTLFGGEGNDRLASEFGADYLDGGLGNDLLTNRGGDSILIGGPETDPGGESDDDRLSSGNGSDILRGGFGDDSLGGSGGADILLGGLGDDSVFGGSGNDIVIGGLGEDAVIGDAGVNLLIDGTTNADAPASDDQADVDAYHQMLRDILAEWDSFETINTDLEPIVSDGEFDVVYGRGLDTVFADPDDRVRN